MTTKKLHILTAITIAVIQSGCVIYNPAADFTKQRYTNTISYFNTFYKAQRLFSDAEDEVAKARRDFLERPARSRVFAIPAAARQKFQTSIEKNSKVLSFYPNSKWVDDALLMIGKAYFYMEDDVRAERKFLELAVQFPESDLILESQLWLGKSLLRQKKTQLGIKQLEVLFANTLESDKELAGKCAYELAQHYYTQHDYTQAEKYYTLAVDLVDDAELRTQIYFQIGKCFTALQQFEKAEHAYANAADASPVYTLLFQAQLQQINSMALQKKYDIALNGLNAMLRDTKNTEFYGTIHFEIANVLSLQGKTSEALEKYRYVDTAFAKTDEAARSYFTLGKYYEETEVNYDSARAMYNKAKSEFPNSEITNDAIAKADIFNKYRDLQKDIFRFDSLFAHALLMKTQLDSSSRVQNSVVKKDTVAVKIDPKTKKITKPGKHEAKKDSISAIDSTAMNERINRGLAQNKMIDSLIGLIIRTKFELGGLFYLEIQQSDSALYWFNDVVKNYQHSEFAPRSLYTIAEIYRTVKQKPKTELNLIYNSIVTNYPASPYANEARKNLGLPIVEAQKDSAQELFEQAEALAESKKYKPAIQTYKNIAEKFSTSPLSPKALYTAGWLYENSLVNNDSANAIYKRLIAKFPDSQFANIARPKIAEYERELKRLEQEKQKEIEAQQLKEQQAKEIKSAKEQKSQPDPTDSLSTPKNKL